MISSTYDGSSCVRRGMLSTGVVVGTIPHGLAMWYDPMTSRSYISSGNLVTATRDMSSSGINFSQGVASAMPTITGVNSRTYWDFDGLDILTRDTLPFASQSGEMWAIMNTRDIVNPHVIYSQALSSTATSYMVLYFTRVGNRMGFANRSVSPGTEADFGGPANNVYYGFNWVSDGSRYLASFSGNFDPLLSGTNNGVWFGDIGTGNTASLGGIRFNNITSQYINGLLGEVLYFNSNNLTTNERLQLKKYLSSKWNVSLP
jgi:hypothetical protein